MKLKAHQRERVPARPPVTNRARGARTVLAGKGALRRFAPLPAPRRSGGTVVATGGSGGNTHGLLAHSLLQNLTHTTLLRYNVA